jgi:hypothetical protein
MTDQKKLNDYLDRWEFTNWFAQEEMPWNIEEWEPDGTE